MKKLLLLSLALSFLFSTPSQSDTNHFGTGGVFELDLGDSEITLTPKQDREQKNQALIWMTQLIKKYST